MNSLLDRFETKYMPEPNTGCWLWMAGIDSDGYGQMRVDRGDGAIPLKAYRIAFNLFRGPVPQGKELDHLCRTPLCVNPAHLEPVTHRENILRGLKNRASINFRKTHCLNGHPFDVENTYIWRNRKRACKTCSRISSRRRYQRKSDLKGVQCHTKSASSIQ